VVVAQAQLQITQTAQREQILFLPQLLQLVADLVLLDQQVKLLVVQVVHQVEAQEAVQVELELQVQSKDLLALVLQVVLQAVVVVEQEQLALQVEHHQAVAQAALV
jgi:hypothetical protein